MNLHGCRNLIKRIRLKASIGVSEEKEKGFHTGRGNNVFGGKEVVSEEGRRRKREW